jgi:hypothetical protein
VLPSYAEGIESRKSRTMPELRIETLVVPGGSAPGKVIWPYSARPRAAIRHKDSNSTNTDAVNEDAIFRVDLVR